MKSSLKLLLGGMALATSLTAFNAKEAQAACDSEPYMSTICYTMSYYCPRGYSEANGQYLAINSYQALYSLLGTVYGGDGRSTFALPDLRGRAVVGTGQGPGLTTRVLGQRFGQEEHTLTIANMPTHSHNVTMGDIPISGQVTGLSDEGTSVTPGTNFPATLINAGKPFNYQAYYSNDTSLGVTLMASDSVSLTISPSKLPTETAFFPPENQAALPLREPQIGVLACIAILGEYPQRS